MSDRYKVSVGGFFGTSINGSTCGGITRNSKDKFIKGFL